MGAKTFARILLCLAWAIAALGTGMVLPCWPNLAHGRIVDTNAIIFSRSATWSCAMVDDAEVGFLGDGGWPVSK